MGSHYPLPPCPSCILAYGSTKWHLSICLDQARPGPGNLGFKHNKVSSIFESPKVILGGGLKKMHKKCKERLWEPSSPRSSSAASPTGPAEGLPCQKPPGKVSEGAMSSFWLDPGPRCFLADSSWALAPVSLSPLLHKHTPPQSSALLPDSQSLVTSPYFGPFSFSFDFFSLLCFLPKP